ncbi:MAG: menaquinone biosynthesis protein [Parafilimonas sp.]
MKKIKVGAVSYLNTKPLLFGIKRSQELMEQMELVEDYPSNIAAMLVDGDIDAGLVPVTVIPKLKECHIISDYCISADGDVASVCLFSESPLQKIESVLLDYQSQTSAELCKILLRNFWKINPAVEEAEKEFTQCIKGTTAGVIIGDRALKQRNISSYIYDLAGAWKTMTGLPFVFAAWIANKPLPQHFISLFNAMNAVGINDIEAVLKENNFSNYNLRKYYTENISYLLTEEKKRGMNLFLEMSEA